MDPEDWEEEEISENDGFEEEMPEEDNLDETPYGDWLDGESEDYYSE